MPQPSFNFQVHGICLLCQQERSHFGSLCLPEVSSESLPTFSDSSPLTRHNWASSHPREWCSHRQNCRSGTWTKVTCFNLGWQRAKVQGRWFQLKLPRHCTACNVSEYAEGWEMSWGWMRRISVQSGTLMEWKCWYSFMRLLLGW